MNKNVVCSVSSYGVSNVGPVRTNNEDNFFRSEMNFISPAETAGQMKDERVGLYILCDGMGGHQKGEVASAAAVHELKRLLMAFLLSPNALDFDEFEELLAQSLRQANDLILDINEREGIMMEEKRMGTTAVIALFTGKKCYVAHIGDSRCYLLKPPAINQLTEDHNLASHFLKAGIMKTREEAERMKGAKMLTQALGPVDSSSLEPSVMSFDIDESCYLVLCSDGLTDVVTNEEIASIVKSSRGNLRKATEKMVKRAYKNKTADNITIIIARFDVIAAEQEVAKK